ncbi:endonuclease [Bacillus sp. V3]|nr:endonuclease [Bacillus sp. V3]
MAKNKCTLEALEIVKLYEEGMRTVKIAEMANVSPRYVNQVLRKNNVKRRAKGSWNRKYTVNEHYFKTWSNNMAYILGFFAADGHISSRTQLVTFSQKDKAILEQIRNELGSNQPLTQNDSTGVYLLNIGSKIMKEDLINLHGMSSEKSHTLTFPTIPDKYLSHFVRGYFDGDGCVNYKQRVVSFVGSSLLFQEELKIKLEALKLSPYIKKYSKHWRLFITGRRSIQIFKRWVYENKELYIARKHEEFELEPIKDINQIPERSLKRTKEAIMKRKHQFIELRKSNISNESICEELKISNSTYHKWVKEDTEFRQAVNKIHYI